MVINTFVQKIRLIKYWLLKSVKNIGTVIELMERKTHDS